MTGNDTPVELDKKLEGSKILCRLRYSQTHYIKKGQVESVHSRVERSVPLPTSESSRVEGDSHSLPPGHPARQCIDMLRTWRDTFGVNTNYR